MKLLASGFIARGFKLLTDDVSRVEISDDTCQVHHSYPSQKLWRDTAEQLEVIVDPEKKINSFKDKYHVARQEIFEKTPKILRTVIEIVPADVERLLIQYVSGHEALNLLLTHSYRQECMNKRMDLGDHLRFCTRLLKHIKVARIFRPKGSFTVNEQVDQILEQYQVL